MFGIENKEGKSKGSEWKVLHSDSQRIKAFNRNGCFVKGGHELIHLTLTGKCLCFLFSNVCAASWPSTLHLCDQLALQHWWWEGNLFLRAPWICRLFHHSEDGSYVQGCHCYKNAFMCETFGGNMFVLPMRLKMTTWGLENSWQRHGQGVR